VERLTYRHTVPGAMGYGQVRPGHNPFDPDRLFVRIGAGLEVGFEGDTLYIEYRNDKRAGGGAAYPPATSSPATTPAWRVAPRRSRAATGRDQGERRVPGVRRPPAQRRASAGRRREGARKGPMGRTRLNAAVLTRAPGQPRDLEGLAWDEDRAVRYLPAGNPAAPVTPAPCGGQPQHPGCSRTRRRGGWQGFIC